MLPVGPWPRAAENVASMGVIAAGGPNTMLPGRWDRLLNAASSDNCARRGPVRRAEGSVDMGVRRGGEAGTRGVRIVETRVPRW
jgi:hypothetical protein